MPMKMDRVLLPQCTDSELFPQCTDLGVLPFGIENSISPVVVTAIFGSMWGCIRGVEDRANAVRSGSVTPYPQGPVA